MAGLRTLVRCLVCTPGCAATPGWWTGGYYQALEERAARLERERDAQALVAAAAERARIAREIHDVVAHNVSVMVVQADGAAFALDGSPQRAREALGRDLGDRAPDASVAASRAAVDAATASDPLLVVNTIADYKATLASRVNQILALFGALLGLAVLIALLGISNTLSLSVIERTRESALMRALGLTRGQLRRMLLTEALLMAAMAIVLGAGLGVGFGVVMVHAFVQSTDGQGLLSIPYAQIALYAAIAVFAALAAAALPARRAARTSVMSAMAET